MRGTGGNQRGRGGRGGYGGGRGGASRTPYNIPFKAAASKVLEIIMEGKPF